MTDELQRDLFRDVTNYGIIFDVLSQPLPSAKSHTSNLKSKNDNGLSFKFIAEDTYHGIQLFSSPVPSDPVVEPNRVVKAGKNPPKTAGGKTNSKAAAPDDDDDDDDDDEDDEEQESEKRPNSRSNSKSSSSASGHGSKTFPIHMFRAALILPCTPREVLLYMDSLHRVRWDNNIDASVLIKELRDPGSAGSSSSNNNGTGGNLKQRVKSLSDALRNNQYTNPSSSSNNNSSDHSTGAFKFQVGQRRVGCHHLTVQSHIPLVQPRDFELLVSEEVIPLDDTGRISTGGSSTPAAAPTANHIGIMKSFSLPMGSLRPLDPQQEKYVRAVLFISGVLARPIVLTKDGRVTGEAEDSMIVHLDPEQLPPYLKDQRKRQSSAGATAGGSKDDTHYCLVEYFGLAHPMGLIPSFAANMLVTAQIDTLRRLQVFVNAFQQSSGGAVPKKTSRADSVREGVRDLWERTRNRFRSKL